MARDERKGKQEGGDLSCEGLTVYKSLTTRETSWSYCERVLLVRRVVSSLLQQRSQAFLVALVASK